MTITTNAPHLVITAVIAVGLAAGILAGMFLTVVAVLVFTT